MRKCWFLLFFILHSFPIEAQEQKAWRDSLDVLNREIVLHPHSTDLRLKKAALNIELEQWEYAVEEYGRVLQEDPQNLAALYFRAYANTTLRHYDLAQLDYESFLSIVPKNFDAQLGLAMIKRKLGRKIDTLDELNKLVQLFPDSALAYAARAGYETELKQYEIALYDWDEALKRQPQNTDFLISKADVLIACKRHEEAWAILEEAMHRGIPRAALKEWLDKCK